jgi:type I restriction enzyme M protein
MSTNTRGEKEIRQQMIEADLVDCMVALPPQLFYNTQIPACLWFLSSNARKWLSRRFGAEGVKHRVILGSILT